MADEAAGDAHDFAQPPDPRPPSWRAEYLPLLQVMCGGPKKKKGGIKRRDLPHLKEHQDPSKGPLSAGMCPEDVSLEVAADFVDHFLPSMLHPDEKLSGKKFQQLKGILRPILSFQPPKFPSPQGWKQEYAPLLAVMCTAGKNNKWIRKKDLPHLKKEKEENNILSVGLRPAAVPPEVAVAFVDEFVQPLLQQMQKPKWKALKKLLGEFFSKGMPG